MSFHPRQFALLATLGLSLRAAQPHPVRVTGMFTDMRYNAAGGDVLGIEVFIVWGGGRWQAVVQCAGGEPAAPVVVPVRVTELTVSFTLPPGLPECRTDFTGRISSTGLRGRFRGENADRWLPRRASYWQR